MKVIAIYTRKSKTSDKGESIQTQIKMCEEYIQRLYPEEETKIIYYDMKKRYLIVHSLDVEYFSQNEMYGITVDIAKIDDDSLV